MKGRNECGGYTYLYGPFYLINGKKTLHLFFFTFWRLLTRNVDVLVFVSTLNPFRRRSWLSTFVKPLVPFISRLFLMAGEYYFPFFRLELFRIHMDIKNHYFSCNYLHDNYTVIITNEFTACPYIS